MPFSFEPVHRYAPDDAVDLAICAALAYQNDAAIQSGFSQRIGRYQAFQSFRAGDPPGFAVTSPNAADGRPASELILCFAGSSDVRDWLENLDAEFIPMPGAPQYHVHRGFSEALDALWNQVHAFLASHAPSASGVPVYL